MALPTRWTPIAPSRVALIQGVFQIGLALLLAFSGTWLNAAELPNPFAELEKIEEQTNRRDPRELKHLMETARQLRLYGMARRYARELIAVSPNDELARNRQWRLLNWSAETSYQLIALNRFEFVRCRIR